MELVVVLLVFALSLGLTVRRVGPGVYVTLFLFAALTSAAFLLLYRQLYT